VSDGMRPFSATDALAKLSREPTVARHSIGIEPLDGGEGTTEQLM
jgi:hypothetical protein